MPAVLFLLLINFRMQIDFWTCCYCSGTHHSPRLLPMLSSLFFKKIKINSFLFIKSIIFQDIFSLPSDAGILYDQGVRLWPERRPRFLCLPIYAYFRYTITNILIRSVKTGTARESVRRSVLACRQAGLSGTFYVDQRQAAPGGPRDQMGPLLHAFIS